MYFLQSLYFALLKNESFGILNSSDRRRAPRFFAEADILGALEKSSSALASGAPASAARNIAGIVVGVQKLQIIIPANEMSETHKNFMIKLLVYFSSVLEELETPL